MFVGKARSHAATRCAIKKSDLDQEWFVHFFERVFFFSERCCQRAQANRPTVIFLNDSEHQAAVNLVETVRVHLKHGRAAFAVGLSMMPDPRTCA